MKHDDRDTYKKRMTTRHTIACLAMATGLSTEQVGGLFDQLVGLVKKHLNEGRGAFVIPGLLKLKVVHRPATAERKGIQPITRRQNVFDAEPGRNVIKMIPSKGLRESVS
jgi:nucleoid DNA-binding protein